MKKLIALVLSVMMLASLAVGTSAAGQILFTDDFTNGFSANNWILDGNNFFLDDTGDDNCLATYSDGVVSQPEFRSEVNGSPKWYTNCDYSIRIQIRDFDAEGNHGVGLWWRDDFGHAPDDAELEWELGEIWNVSVDADNMLVNLQVEGEETPRASAPATGVEVGGDWFTLGWRITPGYTCVFLNGEKIIELAAEDLSAARTSPFILINNNCYVAYDDIVIADLEYNLFGDYAAGGDVTSAPVDDEPDVTTTANGGNNNAGGTTATTPASEATTRVETSIVVNEDGETEIVTEIITEATDPAPAATNTGTPAGGSSTATGDAAFVVVFVMIATLGCAIAVKKVSVR